MNTKDYILELINSIRNSYHEENNYDLAYLEELVTKVNGDKDYFYNFVLDINEELLNEIVKRIDDEDKKKSFLASILYLKKLIEINKEEDIKIPLSENQEGLLYTLYDLIKSFISEYKNNKEEFNKSNERLIRYEPLKEKLTYNKPLDEFDYTLVEKLVYKYENGNIGSALNEVMDYLNRYNYELLAPAQDKVTPLVEEVKEETSKEEIKENTSKVNKEVKNIDTPNIDIFSAQSFVYNEEDKKKKKRKKKEIVLDELGIDDILLEFNLNKNKLTTYASRLIEEADLKKVNNTYKVMVDKLKNRIKEDNINGLITILCLSDKETINELFGLFKKYNLSDEVINDLVNRCTQIFISNNKDNFINNINLVSSYNGDIEYLIKNNITFFYNSYAYNKNKVDLLDKMKLNVNLIFNNKPVLLAIGIEKLLKNIDTLKYYDVVINDDDYSSLSIIGSLNLNKMIDLLIEAGFSDYMFEEGSIKNIRSLIIKRIFYAYKNELDVWNENISKDRLNDGYEELIDKNRKCLTEDDINHLINDYPILEAVLISKKPLVFDNAKSGQIKRKYEYKFNNIIISRLKTFSIFNTLVLNDVNEQDALFYALTYHSNLEDIDYKMIRKEVLGK